MLLKRLVNYRFNEEHICNRVKLKTWLSVTKLNAKIFLTSKKAVFVLETLQLY